MAKYIGSEVPYNFQVSRFNPNVYMMNKRVNAAKEELKPGQVLKLFTVNTSNAGNKTYIRKPYTVVKVYDNYVLCRCNEGMHFLEGFLFDEIVRALKKK